MFSYKETNIIQNFLLFCFFFTYFLFFFSPPFACFYQKISIYAGKTLKIFSCKKDFKKKQNYLYLWKDANVLKYCKASELVFCILQANYVCVSKLTTILACLIHYWDEVNKKPTKVEQEF